MKAAEDIELQRETIADGVIIRPVGDIDRNRAPSFRLQIEDVQLTDPQRLVVDLSQVPFLDSSIVAVLVETVQRARCGSGIVVLCGLDDRVRSVFEVARLDKTLFTIVEDVEEAMAVPNRRRHPRFRLAGLNCDLGEVVDISAGGVRLRSKRKSKGRVELRIWDDQTSVAVSAEVVWSRRTGFKQHEAGLRFVNLCAEAVERLEQLLRPAVRAAGSTTEDIRIPGPALPAPG